MLKMEEMGSSDCCRVKKFVGILLEMGITGRKSLATYWDNRPTQCIPFYSQTMP